MSESSRTRLGLAAIIFGCLGAACAVQSGTGWSTESSGEGNQSPIIGGSLASAYPESALIDFTASGGSYACSGSLIAPSVVLTAGHCVDGASNWKITLPFASKQTAKGLSATTYDWAENGAESVNPNHHDIGLIFLDQKLTLPSWPVLASAASANGTSIVNVGRINNGSFSSTSLYVSKPLTISNASSYGYPYDYVANEIIESGDSGGPDILNGSSPHKIVAVNSGAGGGTEVLARVDLLYSWINQQVNAHGGYATGSGGTGGSGGGSTGGSGGGSTGGSGGSGTGGSGGSSTGGSGGSGGTATCSHDMCATGGTLKSNCDPCVNQICSADSYCCSTKWDSQCVSEVGSICNKTCGGTGGSGGSGGSTSTCSHSICSSGTKLTSSCDTCAQTICAYDPYCCSTKWDSQCVGEVGSFCGLACN